MRAFSVAKTELLYTRHLLVPSCSGGDHPTFSQAEIERNVNECIPPNKNLKGSFVIDIPLEEDSPTHGYK